MRIFLLIIVILLSSTQLSFSQEDGVVSLAIPVRSSLKFNRYLINPTFSFVREQNTYINITNKREWVQFEDSPQTYLANYSGRFRENIGIGVGIFQQNYGVLTTFGGIINSAYNVRLQQDSNLTFGANIGFYTSSINQGKVIVNEIDPSLENISNNMVLSMSPGINYGTSFLDFGLSVNNLISYNIKASELIVEDPQQSVQAHVMYTGYMDTYGFFDESKFSALIKSEFKKNQTVFSGIAMLTVPKGIWAQLGYSTMYGVTGGIGVNFTEQISAEYTYEKAVGDLATFGSSHGITLAYKFHSKKSYYYSGDESEEALFKKPQKKKVWVSKKPTVDAETRAKLAAEKTLERETAQETARLAAEARALKIAEAKALADAQAKEQALLEAERLSQLEAQEKIRLATEEDERVRIEAETRALKIAEAEELADAQAKEQALLETERLAQLEAQEKIRLAAEEDERVRLEAERLSQLEAQEEARLKALADKEVEIAQIDALAKSMFVLTESTNTSNAEQEELLNQLNKAITAKDKDLKDLKEENDLSEQGIYSEPKPFKSISAENNALDALQLELENAINERNNTIVELEKLYNERIKNRSKRKDETSRYYLEAIRTLKAEQIVSERAKAHLISTLETINIATEIERKRRIKRALYDNETDQFEKDKAALERIKENTPLSSIPLTLEDFNFGEELGSNVQILKGIPNVDKGYYMIIAVHENIKDRDTFLEKVVASGQSNIDFFYDVNSSKYFIYYQKFNNVDEALRTLDTKGSKPYTEKMSVVKIED